MKKLLVLLLILAIFGTNGQITPSYTITVCKPPSVGYYFCSLLKVDDAFSNFNQQHLILDNKGNLVYSKKFPKGQLTCDFKLHKNGLMSYYYNNKFYLIDSTFSVVDSVYCKNGVLKDAHELLILPNGNYAILGNEDIEMDLSAYQVFTNQNISGSKKAIVRSGVIQEQNANKTVVFEWHAKDHYEFMDVDPFYLKDTLNVDWTHFNSLEFDTDSNYIVSVRYLNEVTKIKRSDGSILWRLGGKKNEFIFTNDKNKFVGQHDVRRLKNNNLSLLDNGRKDSLIRPAIAKEYRIDEKGKKVELVWSYIDKKNANSIYSGSVHRLPNGNTLINYGSSNNSRTLFNVVDKHNEKIFEIVFSDTLGSYRAFNYKTLPWKIHQPSITSYIKENKLYLDAGKGYESYIWSTGETSQVIEANKHETYYVGVSIGNTGVFYSQPFVIESTNKVK